MRRLAVLLLSMGACGAPETVAPLGFSEHDTELVHQAVEAWGAAGARLRVSPGPVAPHMPQFDILVRPGPTRRPSLIGQCDTANSEVEINLANTASTAVAVGRERDEVFRATVMHELGHAMGLEHEPIGLMRAPFDYAHPGRIDVIDAYTRSLL